MTSTVVHIGLDLEVTPTPLKNLQNEKKGNCKLSWEEGQEK